MSAASDLEWFEDEWRSDHEASESGAERRSEPELPGVVVELPHPGDEIARDERVQAYIRDRLQPAAEALDRLKNVFLKAAQPTPLDGYVAARAAYAYELAQGGKSAEEIAMLLMPTPAQIKSDLMSRIGGR